MNEDLVTRIARAVLYEGYILYPYRPSIKNRQRWTFGGIVPEAYSTAARSGDASLMQTQCIARGPVTAIIDVNVRFLHLIARIAGRLQNPLTYWPEDHEPEFQEVDVLDLGNRRITSWQEAQEREVALPRASLAELAAHPLLVPVAIPGSRRVEPQRDQFGCFAGVLVRQQQDLAGHIELSARYTTDDAWIITLKIINTSPIAATLPISRDDAMVFSFVSTHSVLGIAGGAFISMTDPPEPLRTLAATCVNQGAWPILVGAEGQLDTLLSSPIILSDYPQIAPESPGDLFDSAEIDEILTLRIMTLTDEEKRDVAATDEHARALLARTDSLARDQLMNLHGAMRQGAPHVVKG